MVVYQEMSISCQFTILQLLGRAGRGTYSGIITSGHFKGSLRVVVLLKWGETGGDGGAEERCLVGRVGERCGEVCVVPRPANVSAQIQVSQPVGNVNSREHLTSPEVLSTAFTP